MRALFRTSQLSPSSRWGFAAEELRMFERAGPTLENVRARNDCMQRELRCNRRTARRKCAMVEIEGAPGFIRGAASYAVVLNFMTSLRRTPAAGVTTRFVHRDRPRDVLSGRQKPCCAR